MTLRKVMLVIACVMMITGCAGYTDEQSKAADRFCECMSAEGDFDINYFNCEVKLLNEFGGEVTADEGWALALEEKCPSVAGQIAELE